MSYFIIEQRGWQNAVNLTACSAKLSEYRILLDMSIQVLA
jgi:hypothetical protein